MTATAVPLGGTAVGVCTGHYHTCALLSDGTVKCWGQNTNGQVGDGTTTNPRLSPVSVALGGAPLQLRCGYKHTCAILPDGAVKCWGDNDYGQLGDGTTTSRATPTVVPGLSSV